MSGSIPPHSTIGISKSLLRTTSHAWLDLALLVGILTAINAVSVGKADWGWANWNPSPWFLVPLFMGARYGFKWGIWSGLATAAILFAGRCLWAGDSPAALISDKLFFWMALPGTGFLTGETNGILTRKLHAQEESLRAIDAQKKNLENILETAEESRHQLQERLALHGAEISSLDKQLRGLFEPSAGAIFPNLLRLLRDTTGITDAAIYAVEGGSLRRLATVGEPGKLPESLLVGETEIAKVAIARQQMITCKELWEQAPGQNSPFVVALPWLGQGGVAALLMVHRMKFLSATWRNFSRIQMICRWVAQFVDLRLQASKQPDLVGNTGALIVPQKAFEATLAQAEALHKEYRLPSTVAVFEFTEAVSPSVAKQLPPTVGAVLRSTDVAAFEASADKPVLKVLMPMEGARDAESLLDKALAAIGKVDSLRGKVSAYLSMTETDDSPPAKKHAPAASPAV